MHARDGSLVWVRDESARVLDEQGRLLVEGILTDITERKVGRGPPPAPRRPRRAHRPAQPPPLPRGARARDRRHAPRDALQRRDRARHRRLQVRQRLARPPGRRRADPRRRAHARRRACAAATRSRGSAATSSPACCAAPSAEEADAVAAELLGTLREQLVHGRRRDGPGDGQRGHRRAGRRRRRTAEDVLAAADMAMYEAKHAGRDRVVRFTEACAASSSAAARGWRGCTTRSSTTASSCSRSRCSRWRSREVALHELLLRAARRARRAVRAGRVHGRRRALRPDRGDRPLGAAARVRAPARARRHGPVPGGQPLRRARSGPASSSCSSTSWPRAASTRRC